MNERALRLEVWFLGEDPRMVETLSKAAAWMRGRAQALLGWCRPVLDEARGLLVSSLRSVRRLVVRAPRKPFSALLLVAALHWPVFVVPVCALAVVEQLDGRPAAQRLFLRVLATLRLRRSRRDRSRRPRRRGRRR